LIRIDVINPSQCDVALSLLNESWQDGDDLGYQSVEEMLTILKPKHILAAFNDSDANILGIFFLSSNFPSRSSHICEGVIITRDLYRRRGVGAFMGLVLLEIAKSSGYTLVFQGLVFVNNSAAVALCRKLGMKLLSILPRAGLLRAGRQYTDAMQFYFSFHPNPGTTATTDASEYHDPDDEIWMMEALKLAQKAEEEVQFISYALSFLEMAYEGQNVALVPAGRGSGGRCGCQGWSARGGGAQRAAGLIGPHRPRRARCAPRRRRRHRKLQASEGCTGRQRQAGLRPGGLAWVPLMRR
jgi:RimJ/RimL family protein N-acetyltransferase